MTMIALTVLAALAVMNSAWASPTSNPLISDDLHNQSSLESGEQSVHFADNVDRNDPTDVYLRDDDIPAAENLRIRRGVRVFSHPMEILRRQAALELARRRARQYERQAAENRSYLDRIGKR